MIRRVQLMPDKPAPYFMRDWRRVAAQYDKLAFDFETQGEFRPLIWWDQSRRNGVRRAFGLPSYLGAPRKGGRHEAINTAAAVLGATLVGIDKQDQDGHDWVSMLSAYYNVDNGEALFLNRTNVKAGRTFWYEIYPHVLLYSLSSYYPAAERLEELMRLTADRWLLAYEALIDASGLPDFDHLAFNFKTMRPVDNGRWREPEAAAGVAWLQLMAYARWGGRERLAAAEGCLAFLERRDRNPFYEILLPYGAYAAARMNAEHGASHDVAKLVNWVFDGDSECRPGWGVVAERWGGYDCHGLVGSLTDWGQRWDRKRNNASFELDPQRSGYAFAANTFSVAAGLVPLVRYDARFARDIGKWMLNAANAARLFYPRALPGKKQSCAFYRGDEEDVIAYEGLRKWWDHQSPYATGDAIRYSWGSIDLGLYGSSHAGIFGGIIAQTEVEGILRLDCLRTDYYHAQAYPTYLYYNPYPEAREIRVDVGEAPIRLYDAVSHAFVTASASGTAVLTLPPSAAVLAVHVPARSLAADAGGRRFADGVIIDYQIPQF
ncbi:hypothetical protein [Cohnella nanjingensis]|uniref:Linalool dehydratase/isomerase domain-containing protein n=1 Tax=Cohnella nanjingensis TaxID=1387779 RepID=A0A7X0VFE8_9BACL|nr:hypothetical protein [Cohnella nanjingensis]MBB6671980.1 hypothetical protein [Cohnella nanjingensis]